jgi:hypothetical protein
VLTTKSLLPFKKACHYKKLAMSRVATFSHNLTRRLGSLFSVSRVTGLENENSRWTSCKMWKETGWMTRDKGYPLCSTFYFLKGKTHRCHLATKIWVGSRHRKLGLDIALRRTPTQIRRSNNCEIRCILDAVGQPDPCVVGRQCDDGA